MKFFQPSNRIYRIIIPHSRLCFSNDEEKMDKYGDRLLFCAHLCFQGAVILDFPNEHDGYIEVLDLVCHKMNKPFNDESAFASLDAKIKETFAELGYSALVADIFSFSGTLDNAISCYKHQDTSTILKDTPVVCDSQGKIVAPKYTFRVVDFWNNPQHPHYVLLRIDTSTDKTVKPIQKATWIRR